MDSFISEMNNRELRRARRAGNVDSDEGKKGSADVAFSYAILMVRSCRKCW